MPAKRDVTLTLELALQARIECTLTIEDEEPGKTCRQTLEGEVVFRLMGLGALAERIVVDSLQKVYVGAIPTIVARYVSSMHIVPVVHPLILR
jgi:hypothetical protein